MGKHALTIYILAASNLLPIILQGFYWSDPRNNIVCFIWPDHRVNCSFLVWWWSWWCLTLFSWMAAGSDWSWEGLKEQQADGFHSPHFVLMKLSSPGHEQLSVRPLINTRERDWIDRRFSGSTNCSRSISSVCWTVLETALFEWYYPFPAFNSIKSLSWSKPPRTLLQ